MPRPMVMLVDGETPGLLTEHVNVVEGDVIVATSVEEALLIARGRRVDAAVLRPGGDGQAVASACRQLRSTAGLERLPFSVVGASVVQAQQAFAHGAADFWREPLTESQVRLGVQALLARLPPPARPPEAGKTVLVADDDLFFRRRISDLLEASGFIPIQAQSGTEALSLLEELNPRPALCVMDLFMPGIGGLELVQRIRDNPAWASLPVIAVSGVRRDKALVEELSRLGVSDFVDKAVVAIDSVAAIAHEYLPGAAARRRADRRVSTLALADFRRASEEPWFTGLVCNISTSGAFLRTLTPPREGSVVHLRLELAGAPARLLSRARVAWIRSREAGNPEPHGMGVEFTDFGEQGTRALEDWVEVGSALPVDTSRVA